MRVPASKDAFHSLVGQQMLLLCAPMSYCCLDPTVLVGRQSHSCFANTGHKTAADVSGDLLKLEANPRRAPCQIYDLSSLCLELVKANKNCTIYCTK